MAVSAMQFMPPLDKTPVLANAIIDGQRTALPRLAGFGATDYKPTQVLASGLA
jgi:hypothetical protein